VTCQIRVASYAKSIVCPLCGKPAGATQIAAHADWNRSAAVTLRNPGARLCDLKGQRAGHVASPRILRDASFPKHGLRE